MMHIEYQEEQRWLSQPVPRDGIVCTILEDGKWAASFTYLAPVVVNGKIPVSCWNYARERTWAAYARYRTRQDAAQGA